MLEGSPRSNWQLWSFLTPYSCYVTIEDTRSADVVIRFLDSSILEAMVTDGFSGYHRAMGELNKTRRDQNLPEMKHVLCNAHAIRKFKEYIEATPKDSQDARIQELYLIYQKIFILEKTIQNPHDAATVRPKMRPYFEILYEKCIEIQNTVSAKSAIYRAVSYFIKHYEGLTVCLDTVEAPLTNNLSERMLRDPVIGRKVWLGTHSKQGAKTQSVLFSIMRSCHLNKVDPLKYLTSVTKAILRGEEAFTPYAYKSSTQTQSAA